MDRQSDTSSPLEHVMGGNQRAAQSFRPAADFVLTRVGLFVQDRGTDDALAVAVVPDAGGLPSSTTILASATNNSAGTYEWANFTLTPAIPVSNGATYWIVGDSSGGLGNGYAWRYTNADAFARGVAAVASGAAWTVQPGDFSFYVYGWTPTNVTVQAVPDRTSATSGEDVRYRISLANTGTEDATDVWVNASLDSRLRFVGAGGTGTISVAGSLVTYYAAAIPPGNVSLFLNATAGPLLDDGGYLVLPTTTEFSDGQTRRAAATSAVVEIRAPRVVAALDPASASVRPGDVVTFRVNVANEGRETARHVWLNETLHGALTYLSDTAAVAPERDGIAQSWHFADLLPGVSGFNVTLQVDPKAEDAIVLANFLSVEFTDRDGAGLVRAKSNTIWFTVDAAGGANPWMWGSFAISATLVGGTYLVLARRRLRTEEIFLIHHSGVLLVHMSKSMKLDHDTDILTGMFTAILNFVRDAFHYDSGQELRGMDLGQYRVHVRKGAITYLAIVHRGKNGWIAKMATRAVQDIESRFGETLRTWDGDLRAVGGVREILRDHFLSPTGPSRSREWIRSLAARLDQSFKGMRPL